MDVVTTQDADTQPLDTPHVLPDIADDQVTEEELSEEEVACLALTTHAPVLVTQVLTLLLG